MRTLSQSQMNAVKGGQTYIIYDDGIFCTFVDADSEAEALACEKDVWRQSYCKQVLEFPNSNRGRLVAY